MILYNGASGGLGRFLAPALHRSGQRGHVLGARLEDRSGLNAELARIQPDGPVTFIHLAARVSVPACEADPETARLINVDSARNTVEAVINWATTRRVTISVMLVSTGHVYAAQREPRRLSEEDPVGPRSVYAETKLAAEAALETVTSQMGVPYLVARVFGLLAPGQPSHYVLPGLIERARSGKLEGIPGLDFARDYLDARDVCENLLALAGGWPGPDKKIVNVCSGIPVTIRELLQSVLLALDPEEPPAGLGDATPGPGRPDDVSWIVGDPTRFRHLTGEEPRRLSLQQTVADAVRAAS